MCSDRCYEFAFRDILPEISKKLYEAVVRLSTIASKAKGKGKTSDDANKAFDLHVVCSPEFGSRYKSAWENPPPHTTTPLMPHFDDGLESRNMNMGSTA